MNRVLCIVVSALVACLLAVAMWGCSGAIENGSYDIQIDTDSSMVNVVYGKLDVNDGEMMCTMALHGHGFTRIYQGTTNDGQAAEGVDIVDYVEDADGWYTFTFPVEKLDEEVDYSLFGVRRDRWYDHKLIVHSPGYEETK